MQAPPSLGVKMARSEQSWGIPTELSPQQFRQFVLPHLTVGRRGPAPKLSLYTLFNYILKVLYLGNCCEFPTWDDASEGAKLCAWTECRVSQWQMRVLMTVIKLALIDGSS
jgi:hypothetical protein